jgi:hypothetical protein
MSMKDLFGSSTIEQAMLAARVAETGDRGLTQGLDDSDRRHVAGIAGFLQRENA